MIQILPSGIANLIAAGEVVGRPASVVKELMENSIDAGATSVTINIVDAGRTLIQVIDNGCGMSREDALLCFERHATSKIKEAHDLEGILTYGFRGEALASIAAVAHVTLKTRREEDETAILVEVADSKILSTTEISAPKGCNIQVADLFYNVPARRKFLKSDAAEMRHIEQEFIRVAMVHPDKAFTLKHGGRDVRSVRPASGLKERIMQLCGQDISKELIDVRSDTSVIKISGFTGSPVDARKTLGNQYFFVNGRFFRSPYLHKAVCKPYENMVRDGYTPSYFLFLECDPTKVDVNIHPAKTEVKFTDEYMLFDVLSASIKEALGKNSFAPSIDFESGEILSFPSPHPSSEGGGLFPFAGRQDAYGAASGTGGSHSGYAPTAPNDEFDIPSADTAGRNWVSPRPNYGKLFEESLDSELNVLLLHGKIILTPTPNGVAVINVAKAREAILYHKYYSFLTKERFISQRSLYPQQIQLGAEIHSIIMENIETVNKLGFDVADFGDNAIIVYGMPDGFPADEEALKDAFDTLASQLGGEEGEDPMADYAASLARSAARKLGGTALTTVQAQMMAREVFDLKNTYGTDLHTHCISFIDDEELLKRI